MFKFKAYFPKSLEILESDSMKIMFKAVYHLLVANCYDGYEESVKIIDNSTGKTVCEIGCYCWVEGCLLIADIRLNNDSYKMVIMSK